MKPTIRTSICALCYLLSTVQLQSAQHGPIDSAESFSEVVQIVRPGDTIVIADGWHDGWSVNLDFQGTAENPVTIQPQTNLGVTFTGSSHFLITGSYLTIDGFQFEECDLEDNLLEFSRSDYCRIVNCVFQHCGGDKAVVSIRAGARSNSLIGCRFIDIAARCVNLRISEEIREHGVPTGNIIRDNHFQDIPRSSENGRETIKIGTNQPTYGHIFVGTIVENNIFDRCDGEAEIISNKCSGNIYRRNVFNRCNGELVMRGGGNCLIEGNRIIGGTGGIRICGTGHEVRENIIIDSGGTGIRLYFGMTKEQGGHYQAAGQCLIANNTIVNAARAGILIGDRRCRDWKEKGVQNVAPEGNRILNNVITGAIGDLLLVEHAPNNAIDGNLFHRQGDAIISNPGDRPIYADPLFRNPAAGDFGPSRDSPALISVPAKGATSGSL